MAKPPTIDTTVVPNVELIKLGSYNPSSGPWTVTRDDLDDAVRAYSDPNLRTPIIKLGHDGGSMTDDDRPAVGRLLNLRTVDTEDGGCALVGDYQLPTTLAAMLPLAYPSRSIEGFSDYQPNPMTHKYKLAITGVALLGETAPAIEGLNDLAALFGLDQGEPITASAGSRAITITQENNMSTQISASVQVPGDVRDQFYDQLSAQNPGSWAYVSEVWNDFVIVEGTDGDFYRVPWSEQGDSGVITYGSPTRVHNEWIDDPDNALDDVSDGPEPNSPFMLSAARVELSQPKTGRFQKMFASLRGDDGTTPVHVSASVGQSSTMSDTTTEVDTTDAGETTPVEASAETVDETTPTVETTEPTTEVTASSTPTGDPIAILASQLPTGFEIIASANLADLRTSQVELAAAKDATRIAERDAFFKNACEVEGRITAAQIPELSALYDTNADAVKALVAKCAPGTVPVAAAKGTSADTDADNGDAVHTAFKALFTKSTTSAGAE